MVKDGADMKVSAPFSTTRNRAKTQIGRKRPHGMPGGVRTHSLKIIQKILEMHGMFGYNVTIMYSTMYSEL